MSDVSQASREIARAVLAWPFDPEAIALTAPREAVVMAIERYRAALIPIERIPAKERSAEDQRKLAETIRSIGLRIRPDFSPDQAQAWIAAMILSLEGLPVRIALAAAADAVKRPISFPGEVQRTILECAEQHHAQYRRALSNLERLLKAIDAPPKIEASDEAKAAAAIIAEDEMQDMPDHLRSLGLAGGWLIEDDNRIRWATDDEQQAHALRHQERRVARTREGVGE